MQDNAIFWSSDTISLTSGVMRICPAMSKHPPPLTRQSSGRRAGAADFCVRGHAELLLGQAAQEIAFRRNGLCHRVALRYLVNEHPHVVNACQSCANVPTQIRHAVKLHREFLAHERP